MSPSPFEPSVADHLPILSLARHTFLSVQIFILNRPKRAPGASTGISGVSSLPSKLFSLGNGFFNSRLFANTLGNSQSNIAAHYDISNE